MFQYSRKTGVDKVAVIDNIAPCNQHNGMPAYESQPDAQNVELFSAEPAQPTERTERELIIQDLEKDYDTLIPRDVPKRANGLQSDFRSPMGHCRPS